MSGMMAVGSLSSSSSPLLTEENIGKLRDIVIEPHGRKRTVYVLRSPRLNSLLEYLRTTEIGMVAVLR
jgi:hypothetical protein